MSVEVTVRASHDSFAEAIKNLRTILNFLEAVPQSSQVSDGQWRPVKVGNVEIGAVAVGADVIGKRAMYLCPSGPPKPAFERPSAEDPRQWHCKNEGCGEEIIQVSAAPPQTGQVWVHSETLNAFCDVPPRNPAYGKRANPLT